MPMKRRFVQRLVKIPVNVSVKENKQLGVQVLSPAARFCENPVLVCQNKRHLIREMSQIELRVATDDIDEELEQLQ
jgi:hypothetical protein